MMNTKKNIKSNSKHTQRSAVSIRLKSYCPFEATPLVVANPIALINTIAS